MGWMESDSSKELEAVEISVVAAEENQVNITPMTAVEARECINAIRANMESLRAMLLELERRRGWEALGYFSWRECAIAEFGQSQRRVYELLEAAKVEENLAAVNFCGIPQKGLNVSQFNALAKLPPSKQAEGLLRANEIARASGQKRTVKHITKAVKQLLSRTKSKSPKSLPVEIPSDDDVTPHTAHRAANAAIRAERIVEAVHTCLGVSFVTCNDLEQQLKGKVFICPDSQIAQWSKHLIKAYQSGRVIEAIALLPLDSQWFNAFTDYALCPLPDGKLAVYLGSDPSKFSFCFSEFGATWHRFE